MKRLFKEFIVFMTVICILAEISVSYVSAAVGQPYDRLSMSYTGNNYIYSNNPEKITTALLPSGTTGKNIVNRVVTAGKLYDVEYSHTNMTGIPLTVAVIVKNNTSSTANVTVLNNATYQNDAYDIIGSKAELEYWNVAKTSTKTIPSGETRILIRSDLNTANYSTGVGKVLFKADKAVNCRVVYFRTGTTELTSGMLTDLTAGDGSATTTAESSHDGRSVIIDYAALINKAFYLNFDDVYKDNNGKILENHNKYNANEFEKPVWYLGSTREYNKGNYGVNYNIRFNNAGGKTLYIIPDWDNINYLSSNSYTIFDPLTKSWKRFSLRKSSKQYAVIKLPNSSGMIFNFVLPGGDNGQEYFTFKEPTTGTAYPVN